MTTTKNKSLLFVILTFLALSIINKTHTMHQVKLVQKFRLTVDFTRYERAL